MSRILAPAGRYEEIADRFAGLISGLKVGDPTEGSRWVTRPNPTR
jgi:hypothetical protein